MTAAEQFKLIGQRLPLTVEGFTINVEVKDVKNAWGRTDVLVSPLYGTGEKWVDYERLKP